MSWTRSSAFLRPNSRGSCPLWVTCKDWWGLRKQQNAFFSALLVTASVSFPAQDGPHLILGTINIFWCCFGAHKKKSECHQCRYHVLLGESRSIRKNNRLVSVFLNWHWALRLQSKLFAVYWMLKFRVLGLNQLRVTYLINFR